MASDQAAAQMVIERTGFIGAPVVRIGEDFVFGFDRKKIEGLLK